MEQSNAKKIMVLTSQLKFQTGKPYLRMKMKLHKLWSVMDLYL